MTVHCPEGHPSAADDYCDTCGSPMTTPAAPAPPPRIEPGPSGPDIATPPAAPATQTCPHCSATNAADNLFCEVCGFDFTTGVMPRVEGGEPSYLDTPDVASAPSEQPTPAAPESDRPAVTPAAPVAVEEAASTPDSATALKPVNRPPSRRVTGDWVVEVWIDPDWFAEQDTDETCPSPAPPEVVRLHGSDALIGRRSRTSVPEVDCGIDSAVSRRQALLSSDGRRWWVDDLDSSNGTWVAPAIGPLPTSPITTRTEIDPDDRIYVGAWTRLVVRPAVESEVRGS